MRERLDKIIEQIKEFHERIGTRRIVLIAGIAVAVIVLLVIIIGLANRTTYQILYTGLSSEEQVEILGAIETLGIETKSSDNGTISVPDGQADSVRAQLAMQGYPRNGTSYDIFSSNVGLTSTDFEKETYKIYQLQNRLEATIKYFSGVRDAKVTIASPEKSGYAVGATDEPSAATASVTVIMQDGGSPTTEQVRGIQKLVSSSVPGMDAKSVTVIDGNGKDVTVERSGGDTELEDSSTLSALKIQLEEMAEESIRNKVLNLLEPIYGVDRVKVAVNCTVDIDRRISEALTYYPSEQGNNSGVKNAETLSWQSAGLDGAAGGVVGTELNTEVPVYPYTANNDEGTTYSDVRTYNYLVSQLTEQIKRDAGAVTDTNVSVVIDSGTLTNNDILQIRDLVAVTAGIAQNLRDEKIAIMDTRFFQEEEETAELTLIDRLLALGPLLYLIIALLILLLAAIIGVIMYLRARKKRKEREMIMIPEEEMEEEPEDWEIESLNLDDMKDTREQVLRDQIRDFAAQNPEIAANLIKNWLREEGGIG